MKISLNTAQWYSNVDLKALTLDELVEKIGGQLGAVDEVVDFGKRYEGIVVAKIISCDKHPNADKLSLCLIDDGGVVTGVDRDKDGYVQVVCGAPNARETLAVAWIPPGVAVPSSPTDDPFVLEAREIRGKVSNGMLASPHELAISEDHSGILEIDAKDVGKELTKPGTPFAKLYGLDDVVIDVENKMFTHRPDCFGVLGVARELAGITGQQFKSPKWYLENPKFQSPKTKQTFSIKNQVPELAPRFMAVAIYGLKVGPSPIWLQALLGRIGIKAINIVVDLTNYYMYLTGQPLHAYDADKLAKVSGKKALSLETRLSKKDDRLKLLGGKELTLDEGAILITSHDKPIGIGGVMGGADTEVDETTKTIVLECANFDMYSIRKTAMKYGLFTEAVTRFNKGQSPLQNDRVLAKILHDIKELAGGTQVSDVIDESYVDTGERSVSVSVQFVNSRLGLNLSGNEMKQLLKNVEFWVGDNEDDLQVIVPFWRTDIHIPEDVVEEIGRLYGYAKLPLDLPMRSLKPAPTNALIEFKDEVRAKLSKAGANEVLTYSFVHGQLLEKAGQNPDNAYQLSNALSPDLQYYRMSLLPSLLDKVHGDVKAGYGQFALFEVNQVHNKDLVNEDKLPIEEHRLALVFAADEKAAKSDYDGAAYYQAKLYATTLLDELGVSYVFESAKDYEPKMAIGKQAIAPFDKNRVALIKTIDGELLGEIGEFKPSVQKSFKLPSYSAGFELDLERLLPKANGKQYLPIPKFPKVEQDITLQVPAKVSFADVDTLLRIELAAKTADMSYTLQPLTIFQAKDSDLIHFSWRLRIASYKKTLVAGEVNKLLDGVAIAAKSLGAKRI